MVAEYMMMLWDKAGLPAKKPNEHIFIPLEAIHRIQNPGKKPVKIIEAQVGSILKETDIVRLEDVYGRIS